MTTVYIESGIIAIVMLKSRNFVDHISNFRRSNNILYLVLFCGCIFSVATMASVSALDEQIPIWTVGKKMPTPRTEFLSVALGDKIYVMGGADYAKNLQINKVEIYDTKTDQWITSTKPMPLAINHGAAVEYNGKIYLPGGFANGKVPTNKLFIYDPKKDEWTEGKPMPDPRGALTAQFINGTLYAIGGLNSSQIPVNTVEAYNPVTNTWTSKKSMPTARHHLESAVIDGKLYAVGGRILGDGVPSEDMHETLTNFNRTEMYDPQTDTWTVKQPMLVKRSGFAATGADGQIFVFGGEGVKQILASVEKYDPTTDKWTFEPSMPSKRIGLEAVTVGNKIYTIGGQIFSPKSGLVALDTNEILNLNFTNNQNKTN